MSRLVRMAAGGVLVLALVACGSGGQPTPAGTPAVTVQLAAQGSAFDKNRLDVPADATFAIDFNNTDAVPHNVSIHGNGTARTGDTFSRAGRAHVRVRGTAGRHVHAFSATSTRT